MFQVCTVKFDVTRNLKNFLVLDELNKAQAAKARWNGTYFVWKSLLGSCIQLSQGNIYRSGGAVSTDARRAAGCVASGWRLLRSKGEAGSCGDFGRHAACRARAAVPFHLVARRRLRPSESYGSGTFTQVPTPAPSDAASTRAWPRSQIPSRCRDFLGLFSFH